MASEWSNRREPCEAICNSHVINGTRPAAPPTQRLKHGRRLQPRRDWSMNGMKQLLAATVCVAAFATIGGTASANDELIKLQGTAGQWAIPAGNYASQRYSTLT